MTIRVLVVDDVEDIRDVVRHALGRHGGFEVVGEAAAGYDAIRLAGAARPDVVLLDLGLPDISGDEVLTTLRDVAPESQVVVYTGRELHDRAFIEQHAAGYVTKGTDLAQLVGLLEDVGRRGRRQVEREFGVERTSVRDARAFVDERLAAWGVPHLAEAAVLVVSELATNAVVHAASSYVVRLRLTPIGLRIEVGDRSAGTHPELRSPDRAAEGGRGLLIVSAVSSAWGVEATGPTGKVTWAEIASA